MKNKIHKALVSKFEAQRDEALATLEVYYNNPVGVGEHPQVIDEMAKQVEKLANAIDCLERLEQLVPVV